MLTSILSDYDDLLKIVDIADILCEKEGSTLPFHRLKAALLWWRHFYSPDDSDYAQKRGHNLLGYKYWLRKPYFIIVRHNGELCGLAPLFFSEVLLNRGKPPIPLISFCADSGLFFFQDFLVSDRHREAVIHEIFNCLEKLISNSDLTLFLGHIPEDSSNIKHIRNEMKVRTGQDRVFGETINQIRGGVYPWNIPMVIGYLKDALMDVGDNSNLYREINSFVNLLGQQTSALQVFAATRLKLENNLRNLAEKITEFSGKDLIAQNLEKALSDRPIQYPYANIPRDSETLYQTMSPSKRYYYKRYMKKFKKAGGDFVHLTPEQISLSDIREYLTLHSARWAGGSAAINDKTISFHEEFSLCMVKYGFLHLFFATFDKKRIAALSCFDIGDHREFYYSGRVFDNKGFGIGKLLVLYSLIDAIKGNKSVYDFGYGGDDYKFDFTANYRNVRSFFFFNKDCVLNLEKMFQGYERIVI